MLNDTYDPTKFRALAAKFATEKKPLELAMNELAEQIERAKRDSDIDAAPALREKRMGLENDLGRMASTFLNELQALSEPTGPAISKTLEELEKREVEIRADQVKVAKEYERRKAELETALRETLGARTNASDRYHNCTVLAQELRQELQALVATAIDSALAR